MINIYKVKILTVYAVILCVALFTLISSCFKEDNSEIAIKPAVEASEIILDEIPFFRSGDKDLIFFRSSLSSDNFLLTPSQHRTHVAFNKDRVAFVDFSPGTMSNIGIGSNFYGHYKIEVTFKDSTQLKFLAYSKDSSDYFRYYPTGGNILRTGHPAKYVSWVQDSINRDYSINEFRDNKIQKITWSIFYDSAYIYSDIKYPVNKYSNWFQPKHLD